jgi:hypothetical protein
MIHLELQTAERTGEGHMHWTSVAEIRAAGNEFELDDPHGFFDLGRRMSSPRHESPIVVSDDPEEWVRSLALVFNAPDLAVAVRQDTNPWPLPDDVDAFVPEVVNAPTDRPVEVREPVAARQELLT